MLQPSLTGRSETQDEEEEEPPYPPCPFSSPDEKKLYQRLKRVYQMNHSTWDAESREAWPYIVEHASLAKSTIGKVTNHSITRNMAATKVTWAHVVALRIIYKETLFKSKKAMKLIRAKFPNGNFNSNAYSEEYTRPIKLEKENPEAGKIWEKKKQCSVHELSDETDDPMVKIPCPALKMMNETMSRFLNEVDIPKLVEETDGPYFTTINSETGLAKAEEERPAVLREGQVNRHLAPSSLGKRKQIPEDADDEENDGRLHASQTQSNGRKKDKPRAATPFPHDLLETSDEMPDIQDVAGSSPSSRQEINPDQVNEALGKHRNLLVENTSAMERNTAALEKNTELLQRLIEQMCSARRKRTQ